MTGRGWILGLAILVLPIAACAETEPGEQMEATSTGEMAPADQAADIEAINAVREREIGAFTEGNVDGLMSILTADAVIMPPNGETVRGTEAVRAWARGMVESFEAEGGYDETEITIAGDWAIERYTGELTLTPTDGGDPIEERMRGIHIYRRQPDGSWKLAQDIWNTPDPIPGMEG